MTQPDGIHTIPVPRGMSVERAWENITRNVAMADREPGWANVEVKDGRMVRVIPPAEIDLLAELNELYRRIELCIAHPKTSCVTHDNVWMGLEDAKRGILDALDGWPA